MKRAAPIKPKYNFRPIFPLFFWAGCFQCGQQFRREWGWECETGPWRGSQFRPDHIGVKRQICKDCASNVQNACDKLANHMEAIKPKGPPPPPGDE